ncbi:MAG: hypothetical protein KC713_00255 [Candidatus Omnitrophica bacterium]|nr:hypothetical protein [Candidatus Omnitrophota bacterium]
MKLSSRWVYRLGVVDETNPEEDYFSGTMYYWVFHYNEIGFSAILN